MGKFFKFCALFVFFNLSVFALEDADRSAIEQVIQRYTDGWNFKEGRGFADDFCIDADFVNIFGTKFSGREEIERRHHAIMDTFLKGSKLEILGADLREVFPELVIAHVYWRVEGFHFPGSDMSLPGDVRDGIFTQVFVKDGGKWQITASQNTLKPKLPASSK